MAKPTELPQWGTAQTNEVEPVAQKTAGWAYQAPVISSYMNWFKRIVYDWLNWLNDVLDDNGSGGDQVVLKPENGTFASGNNYIDLNESSALTTISGQDRVALRAGADGLTLYSTDISDNLLTIDGSTGDIETLGDTLTLNESKSAPLVGHVQFDENGNALSYHDSLGGLTSVFVFQHSGTDNFLVTPSAIMPNAAGKDLGFDDVANRFADAYVETIQANGAAPTVSGSDDLTTRHGGNAILAHGQVQLAGSDPTVRSGSWNLVTTQGAGNTRRLNTGYYLVKFEQPVAQWSTVQVHQQWGGTNLGYHVRGVLTQDGGSDYDGIEIYVYDAASPFARTDDTVAISITVIGAPA